MRKTIITKDTWQRIFIINYYQEFIKEWLGLYDAYMKSNPHPPKKLENECIDKIINYFNTIKENNGPQ